jgi:hypothetical protein
VTSEPRRSALTARHDGRATPRSSDLARSRRSLRSPRPNEPRPQAPRRSSAPGGFRLLGLAALVALAAGPPAEALLRVPTDAATLEQAIREVADGDVIELAAGTYRPQNSRGFRIEDLRKGFTIRAAAGAKVVLDGGGERPLLHFANASREKGGAVVFEGLTFTNGRTGSQNGGGAATLRNADAVFRRCVFRANRSTSTGGALLVAANSQAVLVDSELVDNAAPLRGGALSLIENATVYVLGSRFAGNRVNLPGHRNNASGGAIAVLDSRLRVHDTEFRENQAAWTGGAIYAFGNWPADPATASADVLVSGSRFFANRAEPDTCCRPPGATFGGAIHLENQATLRLETSVLRDNQAERGGAVSLQRAVLEVAGSVFVGNRVPPSSNLARVGADINVDSTDFADDSTNYGAINRRSAAISLEDTAFLAGDRPAANLPDNAGCVRISGDSNRQFGEIVPRDGTLAENRARGTLRRVLFSGCGARTSSAPAQGGALLAVLADLTIEDSVFLDAAVDDSGFGGALAVSVQSAARVRGTTFAGNAAGRGAAIWLSGSSLDVEASTFLANEISPGVTETIQTSFGSSLFSQPVASADPLRAAPATGTLRNNLFVDERGLALWEVDLADGPANQLRYGDNRFFGGPFDDRVFVNILGGRTGSTPDQLDTLVVRRNDGSVTTKSLAPNVALPSRPRFAQLTAIPARLLAAPTVEQGRLFFAWSGAAATLGGTPLAERFGSRGLTTAGNLGLTVDAGAAGATAAISAATCSASYRLCLAADRFVLDLDWRSPDGRRGAGRARALSSDTGSFWFFRDSNLELLAKVLDGTASNDHHWLFAGSLTNLAFELRAVDRQTGRLRTYRNPARTQASLADTEAFPAIFEGSAGAASVSRPSAAVPGRATTWAAWREPADRHLEPHLDEPAPDPSRAADATLASLARDGGSARRPARSAAACVPSATALCLLGGRIRVEIAWSTPGRSGAAQTLPLGGDSGAFWFFRPDNLEILVKVLDGRAVNGHFWLFYGALSNVAYTITLTDTVSGRQATYDNPRGTLASASDTEALPAY